MVIALSALAIKVGISDNYKRRPIRTIRGATPLQCRQAGCVVLCADLSGLWFVALPTEGSESMDTRYESWENLADEVEVTTAQADCWTCFQDSGEVG